MNKIQILRNKLEQKKGKKLQLDNTISILNNEIKEFTKNIHRHEQALEIVKEVGLKTQQQLQYHISGITSVALEIVFENPYELKIEFIERRNKTECDIIFERDGNKIDPISSSGVGAIDVAAFALRIASWTMQTPRSINTIILDEPFKHLRGKEENKKVLQMIKEISSKLNLQIIMVGDVKVDRELMEEYADKIFDISIKKGVSVLN
jgi:DNA repair exonuclease SbcCD ATPase subunit